MKNGIKQKFRESLLRYAANQNKIENFEKVEYYRCYYRGCILKTETLFEELKKSDGYPVMNGNGGCFCQRCGIIDAIIPESEEYDIDDDNFMQAMAIYWFNGYAKMSECFEKKIYSQKSYDKVWNSMIMKDKRKEKHYHIYY